MRIATVAVCLVLTLGVAISAQTAQKANSLQADLERLHNQWMTAFDKGDGATMDRMEVPNLTLVSPDGKGTIWLKPGPRAGKQKPTGVSRTLSNVQVRQFGDAAILTGVVTSKMGNESESAATTEVWARQNGQWMLASVQWSDIPTGSPQPK